MVGAIADWFAVTALFKHPLGMPIPHTALIPKRKDDLGRGLEEFVGENFLQEDIIRDRVAAATISLRVGRVARRTRPTPGGWSTRSPTSRPSPSAGSATSTSRGSCRTPWCRGSARSRSRRCSGGLLAEVVRDDLHHGLVDLVLDELHRLAGGEPRDLRRGAQRAGAVVGAAAAQRGGHQAASTPRWCDWLADIRDDPAAPRPPGPGLDARASWPTTCCSTPSTQARTERLKERRARPPAGARLGRLALERAAARRCRPRSCDPRGRRRAAAARGADGVRRAAASRTPPCAGASTGWRPTRRCSWSTRYGAELTTVITHTIERWDGKEAARRIELHVGRDLQFIRINGTIVGGLVGVVIHAVQPGGSLSRRGALDSGG